MCSARAFQHEITIQPDAYVAILIAVCTKNLKGLFGEEHPSDVMNIKRDDLPEEIWKICEEFAAVFPQDLPKGVPLKGLGHEI